MLREDYIVPAKNGKILCTLRCCLISEEDPPSVLPSYVIKIKRGETTQGKIYDFTTGVLMSEIESNNFKRRIYQILFNFCLITQIILLIRK